MCAIFISKTQNSTGPGAESVAPGRNFQLQLARVLAIGCTVLAQRAGQAGVLLCRCADGQGQTKDTLDLSSSLTLISVLERLLPHLAAQVLAAPLVALKVSAEIPKLSRERERESRKRLH